MNKWKMSFFVVLVLLIATNIFWLYSAIDAGVTYTYQQVSLDEKSKAVEMLGALVVKGGQQYTKKDVLHILRQMNKDAFIVEEENLIDVEGVKFIFVNGKLSEVKGLIRPTHMRPPVVNRRSEFYRPCCQYRSFIRTAGRCLCHSQIKRYCPTHLSRVVCDGVSVAALETIQALLVPAHS